MLRFVLPVLAGLALTAAGARAEAPKAASVGLDDLKYAVTAAQKRGENVDAVAEALAAVEKALAKGAKEGEAPPELVALREAVEAAAKKGENVEAISKELGRVEKALTGKEYARPAAPEPKAEPEPATPFRGGRGNPWRGRVDGPNFGGRIVIGGAGGNFNSTAITISNNQFTIRARRGEVNYVITGVKNDPDALKIVVRDGEKTVEAADVKKVPEAYRPAVESLLKMVGK